MQRGGTRVETKLYNFGNDLVLFWVFGRIAKH